MPMRFLITGASGQIGPYLLRVLRGQGHDLIAWSHRAAERVEGVTPQSVPLDDEAAIRRAFVDAAPDCVIHAAAMSAIAECLKDPAKAQAVNTRATAVLADLAAERAARLVYLSTDLVFDGEKGNYRETDLARPPTNYGRTKLAGEAPVLAIAGGAVLRLPLIVGPTLTGRAKFYENLLASLRDRRRVDLFHDEWRTPLTPDAVAEAIVLLAGSRVAGLFHVGGPQRLSRYDIGVTIARAAGLSPDSIQAVSRLSVPSPEPRSRDTSLDSAKFRRMFPQFNPQPLEESLTKRSND